MCERLLPIPQCLVPRHHPFPSQCARSIKHINAFAHTESVCANNNNQIILTSPHLLTHPKKKCSPCMQRMRSVYDFLHVMILARTLISKWKQNTRSSLKAEDAPTTMAAKRRNAEDSEKAEEHRANKNNNKIRVSHSHVN